MEDAVKIGSFMHVVCMPISIAARYSCGGACRGKLGDLGVAFFLMLPLQKQYLQAQGKSQADLAVAHAAATDQKELLQVPEPELQAHPGVAS
ncbi:hypothetical protein [Pseudomonas cichorii]|uniref:hypothetical protein n=1 Tax=Pseudomonas cichorii TaxID=36746 RepID=UPI002180388F|nr:hypothetical protein [Pseudomonas cichorii]